MATNHSTSILLSGLAAVGLALVVAGVGQFRRRGKDATGAAQADMEDQVGSEEKVEDLPEGSEAHEKGPDPHSQEGLPLDYFAIVIALTIPFWLFGGKPLPIPVKLPVSALALVNPMVAAIILTYRRDGLIGVKNLFKKAVDYPKIKDKVWYLPLLFLAPLIAVLSYAVMRLAGLPLPDPHIPWLLLPVFFLGFFIAGIAEELGWMGYAIDPMQNRLGALKAGLLLGLVWAIYHLIPDLQNRQAADWILWHRLGTIANRILMVWFYNNTGRSVFAVVLFHAMTNIGWALFPNYGSHYNPFITGMITLLVTGIVVLGWDSKTLARPRLARIT
jgi:membrane protease YdiL (CAAX protease family)